MTLELYPLEPPDGEELLLAWIGHLAEARTERPTGNVLPFIMVRRIGGPITETMDRGQYSIQTFAGTRPEARAKALEVHRRIQLLANGATGQHSVDISTGTTWVDEVTVNEFPHEVDYLDNRLPSTIYRFIGTYQMHLRLQAVAD